MAAALVGLPAVAYAQVAPPIPAQAEVVRTFKNGLGEDVVLRRGYWSGDNPNGGFGYEKILNKHRITNLDVVASIVRNPDYVTRQSNGRFAHSSIARLFRCDGSGCIETSSVRVLVIIDYHAWTGPGQFGVVTAYCENRDNAWACPDYVNTAIKA
ncbi:hypothetical protein ACQPZA_35280 [Pseudonocardia xinjiangensis]|uniref:hypothetical protein n=1 Tax=Pseudonocardia xinjiangensis TaxID=75289 RepID=UPI003D91EE7E